MANRLAGRAVLVVQAVGQFPAIAKALLEGQEVVRQIGYGQSITVDS